MAYDRGCRVGHEIGEPSCGDTDHRNAGKHGFRDREPEAFAAGGMHIGGR